MGQGPRSGRWEYRTVTPPRGPTQKEIDDPSKLLNELGANGWDLVTTLDYVDGGTKYLVFKRPVPRAIADE